MALSWTDILQPNVTRIKKKHIQEIRDYLSAHIYQNGTLATPAHPVAVADTLSGFMSATDKAALDNHIGQAMSGGTAAHPSATVTSPGFMSAADKTRLDGLVASQETFTSGVMSISMPAPFSNTGTASNPVLGISSASTSAPGIMSAADKTKLDGIEIGAQKNPTTINPAIITQNATHKFVTDTQITAWDSKAVGTLVTQDTNGIMLKEDKKALDNHIGKSLDGSNPTHPLATGTVPGFMSAADKARFDMMDKLPIGTVLMFSSIQECQKDAGDYFNLNPGTSYGLGKTGTEFEKWRVLKEMTEPGSDGNTYRFPVSANPISMVEGTTGGKNSVALKEEEVGPHTHSVDFTGHSSGGTDGGGFVASGANGPEAIFAFPTLKNRETAQAHENRPPFFALYFIVKYKD